MAQECVVALVGLYDRWRFQVDVLEFPHNLVELRDRAVEASDVIVSGFLSVAIRVQRIRNARFVICEQAEVLRPIARRSRHVYESVGASNGVGGSKALEKEAIRRVVGVPPHLEEWCQAHRNLSAFGQAYMVFVGLAAEDHLRPLDDALWCDVRVAFDGLCCC